MRFLLIVLPALSLLFINACQKKQKTRETAPRSAVVKEPSGNKSGTTNPGPSKKDDDTSRKLAVRPELKTKRTRSGNIAPGLPQSVGQKQSLPQLDLPLAAPTSFRGIPLAWLSRDASENATLGTVNNALDRGLRSIGLAGSRRYYVENGFAVATQIEQIDDAGKPLAGRHRFDLNAKPRGRIWQRLFLPKTGRWRMLLIIVTDRDLKSSGKTLTREEGIALFKKGTKDGLPTPLAERPVTPQHECTAFVYEFHQKDQSSPAEPLLQSKLTADDHLKALIAKLREGQ